MTRRIPRRKPIGLAVGDRVVFVAPWPGYRTSPGKGGPEYLADGVLGTVLEVFSPTQGSGRVLGTEDNGDVIVDDGREGHAVVRWDSWPSRPGLIWPPDGERHHRWRKVSP